MSGKKSRKPGLPLESQVAVVTGAALKSMDRHRGHIVFLDPPYPLEREYHAALDALGENPPELVIVQHSVRFELAARYGPLERTRVLRQGDNALSFFAPPPEPEPVSEPVSEAAEPGVE